MRQYIKPTEHFVCSGKATKDIRNRSISCIIPIKCSLKQFYKLVYMRPFILKVEFIYFIYSFIFRTCRNMQPMQQERKQMHASFSYNFRYISKLQKYAEESQQAHHSCAFSEYPIHAPRKNDNASFLHAQIMRHFYMLRKAFK